MVDKTLGFRFATSRPTTALQPSSARAASQATAHEANETCPSFCPYSVSRYPSIGAYCDIPTCNIYFEVWDSGGGCCGGGRKGGAIVETMPEQHFAMQG